MADKKLKIFDPEGSGYDYATANKLKYKPDSSGHLPSRDYTTGMLLKGRNHPTFDKGVQEDEKLGYKLKKKNDRYYTVKDDEDNVETILTRKESK